MVQKTIPAKLANFDHLPASSLIDVKVVAGVFDCSTNTVWRRYGDLAIKISSQQTRWRVGDVRRVLASLSGQGELAA